MPYLEKTIKYALKAGTISPSEPGHLNFLFTELIKDYMALKGEKYQHYNDVIGALEACKLELYRRKVAPYEDLKIKTNGDVYK